MALAQRLHASRDPGKSGTQLRLTTFLPDTRTPATESHLTSKVQDLSGIVGIETLRAERQPTSPTSYKAILQPDFGNNVLSLPLLRSVHTVKAPISLRSHPSAAGCNRAATCPPAHTTVHNAEAGQAEQSQATTTCTPALARDF